jgi:hypothetical protein
MKSYMRRSRIRMLYFTFPIKLIILEGTRFFYRFSLKHYGHVYRYLHVRPSWGYTYVMSPYLRVLGKLCAWSDLFSRSVESRFGTSWWEAKMKCQLMLQKCCYFEIQLKFWKKKIFLHDRRSVDEAPDINPGCILTNRAGSLIYCASHKIKWYAWNELTTSFQQLCLLKTLSVRWFPF